MSGRIVTTLGVAILLGLAWSTWAQAPQAQLTAPQPWAARYAYVTPRAELRVQGTSVPVPTMVQSADSSWYETARIDMSGAARTNSTDNRVIELAETPNANNVYNFSGALEGSVLGVSFWCGSNNVNCPGGNDQLGDFRVMWDPWISRFIASTFYIGSNSWNWSAGQPCPGNPPTSCSPVHGALAVSKNQEPSDGFYLYVFDLCGPSDTLDGADQPHLAFNDSYITVGTVCNATSSGYPLQVFQASTLAAGHSPVLGSTQWEFQDPLTNNGGAGGGDLRYDAPASTYVAGYPIYLTLAQLNSSGEPQIVLSDVSDAQPPSFYSNILTITDTTKPGSGYPAVGAWAWTPLGSNCNTASAEDCLGANPLFSTIQQAGVYAGADTGHPYLTASNAWMLGQNNSYGHFLAYDLVLGTASIINIGDGQQYTNLLATMTVMPKKSFNGDDIVFAIFASTANNFYPGMSYYTWDLLTGGLPTSGVYEGNSMTLNNGSGCPGNCCRYFDFLNGAEPIYSTNEIFFNGPIAIQGYGGGYCGVSSGQATLSVITSQ
jgi:hypothetical protein